MKLDQIFKKQQKQITNELETKITEYLTWYREVMLEGYPEHEKNYYMNILSGFIDKMACWYEMRFPDSTIESKSASEMNQTMFSDSYIPTNWENFFNTQKFYDALPDYERKFVLEPKYPDTIWVDEKGYAHLKLTDDGTIIESHGVYELKKDDPTFEVSSNGTIRVSKNDSSNWTATEIDLSGLTIAEAIDYMKQHDIHLPQENGFEKAMKNYSLQRKAKDDLLTTVMYKILTRGEPQLAASRALLFAKEFNRDINIPATYGIYTYSPNRDAFIEEYLNAGGNPELLCYKDYRLSLGNNRPADFTAPSAYVKQKKD